MAGSRTLKLTILGDVDNLNKSLKQADNDVNSFGDKVTKVGKVVGAAFVAAAAAAGAYAVKIGIDGVKAAIDDEKAQTQLALALKNATGATDDAIAATEKFILQTSLATGVADDKLRPALQRLALSTQDVTKAQDLLKVALDVATATGKPLETVANALGKAYDGNTAALGKLGLGLTSAELKTMSFTQVQDKLTSLFGGAAAANAETYSGRIARMQVAFDEVKETIGFALLPILEKLFQFINQVAAPALEILNKGFDFNAGLGASFTRIVNVLKSIFIPVWESIVYNFNKFKAIIEDNRDEFEKFGAIIEKYVAPVIGTVLGAAIRTVGDIAGTTLNIIGKIAGFIADVVETAVKGINVLIRAYNSIPVLPNIPTIPVTSVPSVTVPSVPTTSAPKISTPSISAPSISGGGGGGGISSAAASGSSAAAAASSYASPTMTYNPLTGQASTTPYNPLSGMVTVAPTINIGVAGDPEGVARTVVDVLNHSYGRGALGAAALVL